MSTLAHHPPHTTPDGQTAWIERTRVVLAPIAPPSILGLFGFAGATFIVAAHLAGWYGNAASPTFLFPFAAILGGVAFGLASDRLGRRSMMIVSGWPTTNASALMTDNVTEYDATVVSRLRHAGGIRAGLTVPFMRALPDLVALRQPRIGARTHRHSTNTEAAGSPEGRRAWPCSTM